MKLGAILAALLTLGALSATAQWRQDGKPVPDTPWSKSIGEFGAMLLLTEDFEAFSEHWKRPPSPEYRPKLTSAPSAKRGDTVAAVVIFSACSANAQGNCESQVDYKVLSPDGSVYAEHKNGELWKGKAPAPPYLHLSVANLSLNIEPDDPLGTYRIEAVVRDRVSKRQLELSQTLEVLPSTASAPP